METASSTNAEVDVIATRTPEEVDQSLIEAAQRGERSALDLFVRRNDRWVRSVIYTTCGSTPHADDIAQQIWMRVWEQIGTLVDVARWRGWLYTLARNAAIDAGQKAGRTRKRQASFDGNGEHVAAQGEEPALRIVREENERRILNAIKGLPAIYREPFMLRHLEDWSYAQIGEALNLPVDTVETRLVRARRLLRESLADFRTGEQVNGR